MCDENIPRTCKQRFKGIENFLRRVAFNLGNTASQTEVKIISCIPIDVTDLQQKIINLERELNETKNARVNDEQIVPNKTGKSKGININVVETSLSASFTGTKSKDQSSFCNNCALNEKPSNISFVLSALSLEAHKEGSERLETRDKRNKDSKSGEKSKSIFRRRKKKSNKEESRQNTQFVYFAETYHHTPFVDMHSTYNQNKNVHLERRDVVGDHLSNVLRKQYDPKFGIEEFSDTSDFSRPICKDITNPLRYDSDICSCCHGRFQNIDNYMGKGFNFMVDSGQSQDHRSSNQTYYDSDLYDIVPVKEISGNIKQSSFFKDDTKKYLNFNCWPETIRTKHRANPVTLSYRAEIPAKHRYYKQTPLKAGNPRSFMSKSRRQKPLNIDHKINEESSNTCSIECGVVYTKPLISTKVTTDLGSTMSQENNTVQIRTAESQTKRCKSIQLEVNLLNDNNTEIMLEQIKNILQSVLAEVKTNTHLNKEEKPKKDAIVQKGSSQNNMPGCSTLLHSLTYNGSHNANSYYTPYSPHIPPNPLCYASIPYQPVKCMQNLQYLLHPCHRHEMNSCHYAHKSVHSHHNKPVNIAINTEGALPSLNTPSKETNNLIKDIYKSIALSMDYSTKASSRSEYNNLKSSENNSSDKFTHTRSTMRSEADVIRSDKDAAIYLSSDTARPLRTKLHYAETSAQSEDKSETKETNTKDMKRRSMDTSYKEAFQLYRLDDRNHKRLNKYAEQDRTEISSDGEESDKTVVQNTQDDKVNKEKKGLLQRFFRSVKLLKRRKPRRIDLEDEEEDVGPSEESDSEDYETMYSESVSQSQYRAATPVKSAYAKKSAPINIQVNGKRISRSPYMEQEEKREWNEMFQEKYYPGRSGPSRSVRMPRRNTPYRKNYEVRSVIVDDRLDSESEILDHDYQENSKQINTREKMSFLKKHKLGLNCRCGERFKNLILEN
ncbi:uncharacterized protein LOC119834897 [Zerene cesonia]|uniref:uncharacterized protein LOC119834897 n=1 Tax=Zerene cesonia TaxID=33412 RepID=UPI0018E52901|nr:uncharacterized protein LOC119834897 [Zerene cesonia]